MPNAPAPLSVSSFAAPQAGAARRPTAFSYENAVAALERQSGRSLEIHGGAPQSAVNANRAAPTADAAVTQESAANSDSRAATAQPAAPEQNAASQRSVKETDFSPYAAPASSASVTRAIAAPAAPVALSQSAPLTATGLREGALRLKAEAALASVPARPTASAVKQFAEILAQRIDNASQFDLRLDPPALGSIEGRLTLSDDRQAVLSLSFDNPSTYDLFRRDEAALRLALADAGFDLGGRNLQFSFREQERAGDPAHDAVAIAEISMTTPAPLHRGAVDIRA